MQVLGAESQFSYQSPALGFGGVKAAFSSVLLVKLVHLSLHGYILLETVFCSVLNFQTLVECFAGSCWST